MAISVTALTSGSSTSNTTSYTTASISPTAGRLLVAFVWMSGIGTATATTISGLSGTWTNQTGSNRPTSAGLTTYDLSLFTCTNYTGTGTLAIGNTDSATSVCWSIIEVNGADLTTPVVAGSLQEPSLGDVSTGTVTLNSPANAANRPFVAFGCNNNTTGQAAPRTNWTEIHDVAVSTPAAALETQWRSDAFETTASVDYTGGPYTAAAVAVEIAVAAMSFQAPAPTIRRMLPLLAR